MSHLENTCYWCKSHIPNDQLHITNPSDGSAPYIKLCNKCNKLFENKTLEEQKKIASQIKLSADQAGPQNQYFDSRCWNCERHTAGDNLHVVQTNEEIPVFASLCPDCYEKFQAKTVEERHELILAAKENYEKNSHASKYRGLKKIGVWFGVLFAAAAINTGLAAAGIHLGGIPTVLLYGVAFLVASSISSMIK